jgi:hypothetical protein
VRLNRLRAAHARHLVLGVKLTADEKKDLVTFLRAL